jgi:hypothetical protein
MENGLIFKLYRGPNDFIMKKSVFLAGNANTSWLIMFIYSHMVFLKKKEKKRRYQTTQYQASGSDEAPASDASEASSVSSSAPR